MVYLNSQPEMVNPVVNIKVNFFDDYRPYKSHKIVALVDLFSTLLESFDMIENDDIVSSQDIYDELIGLAFHPKSDVNDYCMSVLKYCCCASNIRDRLNEYPDSDLLCILDIHIEKEESSGGFVFKHEGLFNDDMFKLVGKLETGVEMTLPTKFQFLTDKEFSFLTHLVEMNNTAGQPFIKLTYCQLYDLVEEYLKDSTEIRDRVDEFLIKFSFYGLIDYRFDDDFDNEESEEPHFLISVCNLELYDKFIEMSIK